MERQSLGREEIHWGCDTIESEASIFSRVTDLFNQETSYKSRNIPGPIRRLGTLSTLHKGTDNRVFLQNVESDVKKYLLLLLPCCFC